MNCASWSQISTDYHATLAETMKSNIRIKQQLVCKSRRQRIVQGTYNVRGILKRGKFSKHILNLTPLLIRACGQNFSAVDSNVCISPIRQGKQFASNIRVDGSCGITQIWERLESFDQSALYIRRACSKSVWAYKRLLIWDKRSIQQRSVRHSSPINPIWARLARTNLDRSWFALWCHRARWPIQVP